MTPFKTQNKYERKETYPVDAVLSKVMQRDPASGERHPRVNFDGDMIKMDSQRYILFKKKGCTCVKCGLVGTFFAKERNGVEENYHFNLYGIKDGREVMLTKDHIMPKSKGGKNVISNYNVMCIECNREKADIVEGADELEPGTFIAFGYHPCDGTPVEIMVADITAKVDRGYVVHFMDGLRSDSRHVPFRSVLAIGDPNGNTKLKGWGGRFKLMQLNSKLLAANVENTY